MADLDEFSYQRLSHNKEVNFDALLRLISEYETALNSINSACDAIDSKAGVILSASIAIALGSIGYIFSQSSQTVEHIPLAIYAFCLGLSAVFCMMVIWARKHISSGVLPEVRDTNFSLARQFFSSEHPRNSDIEFQLVKLDALDGACDDMRPIVKRKSRYIKLAQNWFSLSSAIVFAVYFIALISRLY